MVMMSAACASVRYSSAFNPSVTVEVEHPPSVGFLVDEVVLAGDSRSGGVTLPGSEDAETRCEAEWLQVLTQELVELGVRVARGDAGQNTDAVITVDVTRCETEQDRREGSREIVERVGDNTRRRTVPEYHARTRVRFRGTFEVVNPSTGLVAASRTLAYEPESTNSSVSELPEFPSPGVVARRAYVSTIRPITPILFRRVEARELVFFDDERCDLDVAHRAVEAGDYERALVISIANVSSCQPDPAANRGHGGASRRFGRRDRDRVWPEARVMITSRPVTRVGLEGEVVETDTVVVAFADIARPHIPSRLTGPHPHPES